MEDEAEQRQPKVAAFLPRHQALAAIVRDGLKHQPDVVRMLVERVRREG